MKKQKIASAIGLYIAFMFIGHQGPLATHKSDDQPHTHNKHVVKLMRNDDDSGQPSKGHRYAPLTV